MRQMSDERWKFFGYTEDAILQVVEGILILEDNCYASRIFLTEKSPWFGLLHLYIDI